jgi:ketosteroid isomerase-like protein
MSTEQNVQTVQDFFAAAFGGDREAMLALVAEDIEWIIPGEDWPLAGMFWHDGFTVATFVLFSHPNSALVTASCRTPVLLPAVGVAALTDRRNRDGCHANADGSGASV